MKPTAAAYKLIHEGSLALARMEANGLRVDEARVERTCRRVDGQIAQLDVRLKADPIYARWRRIHGSDANLGSDVQLGRVLFEDMKLPCRFYTPGGKSGKRRPSTAAEHLAILKIPFVDDWLRRGRLVHLRGTSLAGLKRETIGGYFHPVFNLHTARTYRSSSGADQSEGRGGRDMNIQNLPIRDPEFGRYIRRCFIPRDGWHMVEIDYAALEWRIAASFWGDPDMIAYASDPTKDVHRDWAAETFLCEPGQVSKGMRGMIKSGFVFATLYGSYYVQTAAYCWVNSMTLTLKDGTPLHEHLASKGITELGDQKGDRPPRPGTFEAHMKRVEDKFFAKFHVMRENKSRWLAEYRRRGGFPLMTGFWISGEVSNNQLLNTPVQGPGFHCLLWSLIELDKWLAVNNREALLLGEIHDSGLADVPPGELQEFLTTAERIMTKDIRAAWPWIQTPLEIEVDVVDVGASWFDKKPWIKRNGVWGPKEMAA